MSGSESDAEGTATTDEAELEAAIAAIRSRKDLPRPAYPMLPNLSTPGPMAAKVQAVQAYIEKLSYNFTGVNYFDVRKQRPMGRIMETARDVTRQALPIKCVEAVFLATYLTQGLRDLERVAVSFKSTVDGQTCKHIILALKHNSKWGSVGLSRRRELYHKEMIYDSLADLVLEFKRSYERVFHTLKRVKVGLPMSHDPLAGEHVFWDYLLVRFSDMNTATERLAEHGRTAHKLHEQWKSEVKKVGAAAAGPPKGPIVRPEPRRGADRLRRSVKERGASGDSDSSDGEGRATANEERLGTGEMRSGVERSSDDIVKPGAAAVRPSFLAV